MTLLYRRAYIVAPSAGPKVPLMDCVEQPIKGNCQDISHWIVGRAVVCPYP
ncbi:hypothetical protein A2U01_0063457, partial [Trifolium medium]|nr:hypothetical protein [Trifolium medium]